MNEALATLETEFSENEKRLSIIKNEIAALMQESEIIKKNNEHIAYSIGLIKKPLINMPVKQNTRVFQTILVGNEEVGKKTLRATVLDIIKDGESISVGSAWERVTKEGINTTRATVNSTLHNLVKRGDLI